MTTTYSRPSLTEWFEGSPVQMQYSSTAVDWETMTMHSALMYPTKDYYIGPETNDDTLAVVLNGTTMIYADIETTGDRNFRSQYSPGSINIIPRNYLFKSSWDRQVQVAFLMFSPLTLTTLASCVTSGDPQHITLHANHNFHDRLLYELTIALNNELKQGGAGGLLYANSLAQTMMLHLLRHYSNLSPSRVSVRATGKLTREQQHLIEDYIDAYLEQKITLSSLAAQLSMSTPHFERLFQATYLMAPYQFVLFKRIERARELLCDKRKSLYDVARECGFASQSHFTRHFKAIVGVTPGYYVRCQGYPDAE